MLTKKELDLNECMMPRDVTTCWNSLYNMLQFALDHCPALDLMTGNCDMKLRQYELDLEEWGIIKDLYDVLKVCLRFFICL